MRVALFCLIHCFFGQSTHLAPGMVSLTITHNYLKQFIPELRIDLHTTVGDMKVKLYRHVGTPAVHQKLALYDWSGNLVRALDDESKMLGFYGIETGMRIHVTDTDPFSLARGGGLEDVSLVKKFELTDEQYNARGESYRKFREEKRKVDPTWSVFPKKEAADPESFAEEAAAITVGQRCEVIPGGRRGTVRFVGKVEGLPGGWWIGVEYDEPVGKNNGEVKGQKLFSCADNYGGMVRPDKVQVGDYPEECVLSDADEI